MKEQLGHESFPRKVDHLGESWLRIVENTLWALECYVMLLLQIPRNLQHPTITCVGHALPSQETYSSVEHCKGSCRFIIYNFLGWGENGATFSFPNNPPHTYYFGWELPSLCAMWWLGGSQGQIIMISFPNILCIIDLCGIEVEVVIQLKIVHRCPKMDLFPEANSQS